VALSFDGSTKIISLSLGTTSLTCVEMYSAWVDWVALSDNIKWLPAFRTVGGDAITATQNLGVTFFITNGWRVRPQEANHRLTLDGNLYTDPSGDSPFVPTLGSYNVTIETKVSSLVDSSVARLDTDNIKYQIESMRPTHQGFGSQFYVSPQGSDLADGAGPTTPVLTIAKALELCVSGRGDTITILAPSAGQVTFAETVVVDKEDVHLRGPGRGVIIQSPTGNSLTINSDNCSVSGLFVKTAVGSSHDGIVVNGKFCKLDSLYLVGADTGGVTPIGTGNGIHFRGGDYHKVFNCVIEKFGGDGIKFTDAGLASGAPREVVTYNTQVYFNRQHGVNITGASSNSTRMNVFENNQIVHNSGYGVYIGANTQRNMIHSDNYIKDNGTYPSGAGGTEVYYVADATTDAMIDNMADTMPAAVASATWGKEVEGAFTAEQVLRIVAAALAGERVGLGTPTETYKALGGSATRISITPDAAGNGTPIINGAA